MAFAQTITTEQKVTFTLTPRTAGTSTNPGGQPSSVDGAPVWTVEGDATLTVAEDGMSAVVFPGAANALSIITAKADGDMSEGIAEISEVITLTVIEPGTASLGVSANVEQQ